MTEKWKQAYDAYWSNDDITIDAIKELNATIERISTYAYENFVDDESKQDQLTKTAVMVNTTTMTLHHAVYCLQQAFRLLSVCYQGESPVFGPEANEIKLLTDELKFINWNVLVTAFPGLQETLLEEISTNEN